MEKTLIDCFDCNVALKMCVKHMLSKAIPVRLGNLCYWLDNSVLISEEEFNELQSLANAIDLNIEMTIKAE